VFQLTLDKGVESSFPNEEIMLRMYLVLMVTNCGAERSFPKMRIIIIIFVYSFIDSSRHERSMITSHRVNV